MPAELGIYSKTCLLKAGEGPPRMHGERARKSLPGEVQVEEVLAAHRQKTGWWGRACEGVEGLSLQQQRGGYLRIQPPNEVVPEL